MGQSLFPEWKPLLCDCSNELAWKYRISAMHQTCILAYTCKQWTMWWEHLACARDNK